LPFLADAFLAASIPAAVYGYLVLPTIGMAFSKKIPAEAG
jgi:hypothetical protein